jgi:hypothetical protein
MSTQRSVGLGFLFAVLSWNAANAANPTIRFSAKGSATINKASQDVSSNEKATLKKRAVDEGRNICHILLTNKAVLTVSDLGLVGVPSKSIRSSYEVLVAAELANPSYEVIVPRLIAVLKTPFTGGNFQELGGAMRLLAQIGEPAVPGLLLATKSTEPQQRQGALETLASMSKAGVLPFSADLNRQIVRQAISLLKDPAGDDLGRFPIDLAAERFLSTLVAMEDENLDALIDLVGDKSQTDAVRGASARVLRELKNILGGKKKATIAKLMVAIKEPVNESGDEALKLRSSIESALAAMGTAAVPSLVTVLENDRRVETRTSVAKALAGMSGPPPLPVSAVVLMLALRDKTVRLAAARSVVEWLRKVERKYWDETTKPLQAC